MCERRSTLATIAYGYCSGLDLRKDNPRNESDKNDWYMILFLWRRCTTGDLDKVHLTQNAIPMDRGSICQ